MSIKVKLNFAIEQQRL